MIEGFWPGFESVCHILYYHLCRISLGEKYHDFHSCVPHGNFERWNYYPFLSSCHSRYFVISSIPATGRRPLVLQYACTSPPTMAAQRHIRYIPLVNADANCRKVVCEIRCFRTEDDLEARCTHELHCSAPCQWSQ